MTFPNLEQLDDRRSPVRISPTPVDSRMPLRWTTVVLVTATAFLAITNAPAASAWLDAQPATRTTAAARSLMGTWKAMVGRANTAHRWIATQSRAAHDWRFGDEHPGETGADAS